jgi:hypothetical protein
MWVVWWLVLRCCSFCWARFWCAVCPFGVIPIVQKLVGEPAVPRFLKTYGIWIIDACSRHPGATTSGDRRVALGLGHSAAVAAGVIVSGAFIVACLLPLPGFLGGLCGNYSRAGWLTYAPTSLRHLPAGLPATQRHRRRRKVAGSVVTFPGRSTERQLCSCRQLRQACERRDQIRCANVQRAVVHQRAGG